MLQVNKDNFDQEVRQSEIPVIVDVWGPSCMPCLKLMPGVEELASAHEGMVKIVKLNSAENRRLCIDLRVMGLPTFLLFQGGVEVSRTSGQQLSLQDIKDMIDQVQK